LDVLGFATREPQTGRVFGDLSSLGTYAEVGEMVRRLDIREVIVATSALERDELVELFRELAPIPEVELRLSGGLFEIMTTGLSIKEVAFVPLVTVHPSRLKGVDLIMKTLLDYAVATACVVLGSLLYMGIAVAVKLDSPGPVFHRREVLGQGGRRFRCYKFRTMVCDAEDQLALSPEMAAQFQEKHKLEDDPRITRLGRFLRKSSLDELPQMFNVLLGDMSVVGPRMISPAEHARYGKWDMNLLTLKPGITGLWQVSGRSETSYDERVQLDMNYVRNWSIWVDLQILLQTIPAVLKGRGAY
jgi:exopolysaccharide biosynthesis polyprenyl glycosylphosphotransferase